MTYQVLRDEQGRVAIMELYRDPVGRGLAQGGDHANMSTDDDRVGEYWQAPLQPEVHPDDSCGCLKPPGHYGRHGWHFNAAGEAVERCPAYMATVKRHGGWKRPRRKR